MIHRLRFVFSLLVAALLFGGPTQAQTGGVPAAVEREARGAAQEWLGLLEEGDYEDSWEEAAGVFRDRVGAGAWEQNSKSLADSIGAPVTRTLTTIQYQDSIRSVDADGPFVIMKYRTRFPEGHFEELLVVVEDEEAWRVAGYRVSPLRTPDPPMPVGPPEPSSP